MDAADLIRSAARAAPLLAALCLSISAGRAEPVPCVGKASFYEGVRNMPLSAAHRTLPFGTRVLVRNQRNKRTVIVTIADRGPFIRGRIIDLSRTAASRLEMMTAGVVPVVIEVLPKSPPKARRPVTVIELSPEELALLERIAGSAPPDEADAELRLIRVEPGAISEQAWRGADWMFVTAPGAGE